MANQTGMRSRPLSRRALAVLVAGALAIGLVAGPATAGRTKTVKRQWDVVAAPFPGADGHTTPSEECGVEGATYGLYRFKAPGRGKLDVRLSGFEGEWDLYVTDSAGNLMGSSVQFMTGSEERVVVKVPSKKELLIYACNFAGGPTAQGKLKYVY